MNETATPVPSLSEALNGLAEMPALVEAMVARHGADAPRRQPKPGDFSLVEHACHLRDLEREGYLVRVARILAEDVPELAGFNGGAIAAARNYPEQDPVKAAQDFTAARHELLAKVRSLPPQALTREAVFAGKRITLTGLLGMMAGHDAEHRQELEALDRWLASP